jgi:hypothetical protein
MTNDEAKFILQSYRRSGADAENPVFIEALEHARRDPQLSQWLAEEMQLDSAVSRKIKSAVPIPADLKSTILAGGKIVRPPVWYRRSWFAAAACFFILLGVTGFWILNRQAGFPAFRSDMLNFVAQMDRLDLESTDVNKIREWMKQNNAHGDFTLTQGLAEMPGIGCRVLSWNGQKITLICFGKMGPQEIHLFIADRSAFPKPPPMSPQFAKEGAWTTASWSRGDKAYMLAGMGDRETLTKYL